jgi:carboxypeptidase C (cathepsin A)
MATSVFLCSVLLAFPLCPAYAKEAGAAEKTAEIPRAAEKSQGKGIDASMPEEMPVATRHTIKIGGKTFGYTTTAGMLPIRNEAGETEACIFFVAYTAEHADPTNRRPLIFAFNGGPGSSSVWLHLGIVGPRRVNMQGGRGTPAPPYDLIDNEYTWLDQADLVFVDPVGTGFSRLVKPELGSRFFSLKGDVESVAEFIRLYLTRYDRWASPLFLAGESYGSTRASSLSIYLIEHGIALNGMILISPVLNFQTIGFAPGNDLPYVLSLPSYTAAAWYHKKLPPDLGKDLKKALEEVERWAANEYTVALMKGNRLTEEERREVTEKLARYTGLEKRYLENSNLRIESLRFTKELLRDRKQTVGRFDSRMKGMDVLAVSERADFDPSLAAVRAPYTAMLNHYLRTEIGYKSDLVYHILGSGIGNWDWGTTNGYVDTSDGLQSAFARNPHMKLFVALGDYDLATPYFATEYTLNRLGIDSSLRGNIQMGYYEAGHMMYIDDKSITELKRDLSAFIQNSLRNR